MKALVTETTFAKPRVVSVKVQLTLTVSENALGAPRFTCNWLAALIWMLEFVIGVVPELSIT